MASVFVDYRKIIQVVAPLAAALIAIASARMPAQAQTNHMLVIPSSDGYGFDDCMGSNKPCGRVIADAWCEAHGMSASLSFGRAEDITASISSSAANAAKSASATVAARKFEPGSFVVNCKD